MTALLSLELIWEVHRLYVVVFFLTVRYISILSYTVDDTKETVFIGRFVAQISVKKYSEVKRVTTPISKILEKFCR